MLWCSSSVKNILNVHLKHTEYRNALYHGEWLVEMCLLGTTEYPECIYCEKSGQKMHLNFLLAFFLNSQVGVETGRKNLKTGGVGGTHETERTLNWLNHPTWEFLGTHGGTCRCCTIMQRENKQIIWYCQQNSECFQESLASLYWHCLHYSSSRSLTLLHFLHFPNPVLLLVNQHTVLSAPYMQPSLHCQPLVLQNLLFWLSVTSGSAGCESWQL